MCYPGHTSYKEDKDRSKFCIKLRGLLRMNTVPVHLQLVCELFPLCGISWLIHLWMVFYLVCLSSELLTRSSHVQAYLSCNSTKLIIYANRTHHLGSFCPRLKFIDLVRQVKIRVIRDFLGGPVPGGTHVPCQCRGHGFHPFLIWELRSHMPLGN